ncbi:B12-binding domain-containing radical SAM protein [candidate division WWE3 bacterium CG08_land_8_20_14_0_20_40_13]|uniref:B12-binding domain-containing radical SAM protein n=1 Tax=candidate division WWE3 bacterium CG08_land_8_20_14_0_20_40_13 TaxID=1975084 RepID=A0A2H0XDC1_UNCKA|nr:MAG: B12-binding domain-containing radical SAM protein [candidate division WWE3 bacterium CG08_land_8_20_14_0_20_40_13]
MSTVVIGYPPIETEKGTPLLSQNRQFQYFNAPTYIYPMVPAYAATMVKEAGYTVYWMDGIAEKKFYQDWVYELKATSPDYLLIETKAPVIKAHWKIIDDIKLKIPDIKIILVGDHVTYFPEESFNNSKVDFVIVGGDYDFVLVNLLNHLTKGEKLEGGVYQRKGKTVVSSGAVSLKHNLDDLPFIDRDLTRWELYAYENGNYKYTPATYMYSGRDCWWNRCTFCIWDNSLNPRGSYRSMSPERLFNEVKFVVDRYKVKEIFDDAGTLFIGPKLKKFCELLIESGYNKKVVFGCNMRFNALTQDYYNLMKSANFRFLLYGMESGNQKTLDMLDKGTKEADTINGARMASQAGLEPHATIMLGYPWESLEDAKRTIEVAKYCFKKGYFHTMQATIIIPYPGTPLWKQAKENKWLLTEDYDEYDMRGPVMRTPFDKEKLMELTQELYSAFFSPQYIARKVASIRSIDDVKFFAMAGKRLVGHLLDFDPNQKDVSFKSPKFWKDAVGKLASHFIHPKTAVDKEKEETKLEDSKVNL